MPSSTYTAINMYQVVHWPRGNCRLGIPWNVLNRRVKWLIIVGHGVGSRVAEFRVNRPNKAV